MYELITQVLHPLDDFLSSTFFAILPISHGQLHIAQPYNVSQKVGQHRSNEATSLYFLLVFQISKGDYYSDTTAFELLVSNQVLDFVNNLQV